MTRSRGRSKTDVSAKAAPHARHGDELEVRHPGDASGDGRFFTPSARCGLSPQRSTVAQHCWPWEASHARASTPTWGEKNETAATAIARRRVSRVPGDRRGKGCS